MNKFKNKKILKCFCNKIGDYYEYMSSQIQNEKIIKERIIKDDVDELLKIIKCPMTDMNLEIEKDFLKASHIYYPIRNGIYILTEEDANFKF